MDPFPARRELLACAQAEYYVLPIREAEEVHPMKPETAAYLARIAPGSKHFELMERYVPGWVDANVRARQVFFPLPEDEADARLSIPRKYRELIMVAIEIATQQGGGQGRGNLPGVTHSRKAVEEGATAREIAEVVAIAAYLCGQPALIDYGAHCIEAAEQATGSPTE